MLVELSNERECCFLSSGTHRDIFLVSDLGCEKQSVSLWFCGSAMDDWTYLLVIFQCGGKIHKDFDVFTALSPWLQF